MGINGLLYLLEVDNGVIFSLEDGLIKEVNSFIDQNGEQVRHVICTESDIYALNRNENIVHRYNINEDKIYTTVLNVKPPKGWTSMNERKQFIFQNVEDFGDFFKTGESRELKYNYTNYDCQTNKVSTYAVNERGKTYVYDNMIIYESGHAYDDCSGELVGKVTSTEYHGCGGANVNYDSEGNYYTLDAGEMRKYVCIRTVQ